MLNLGLVFVYSNYCTKHIHIYYLILITYIITNLGIQEGILYTHCRLGMQIMFHEFPMSKN